MHIKSASTRSTSGESEEILTPTQMTTVRMVAAQTSLASSRQSRPPTARPLVCDGVRGSTQASDVAVVECAVDNLRV